jgi:hypothetical protein
MPLDMDLALQSGHADKVARLLLNFNVEWSRLTQLSLLLALLRSHSVAPKIQVTEEFMDQKVSWNLPTHDLSSAPSSSCRCQ